MELSRLTLIEGIPGTGKTTTSKKFKERYPEINVYQEGDLHPADLAWQSVFSYKEYEQLLEKFPTYKDVIEKHSQKEEYVIVAYTLVMMELKLEREHPLHKALESKEVYRNATFGEFKELHFKRWKNFKREGSFLFECTFFQNHISELILNYQKSKSEIIEYLKEMISNVKDLEPTIIYLYTSNVEKTISEVAKTRPGGNGWPPWIELVKEYLSNSNKFKRKVTLKEVYDFFEERIEIELEALALLDVEYEIIDVTNDYKKIEGLF